MYRNCERKEEGYIKTQRTTPKDKQYIRRHRIALGTFRSGREASGGPHPSAARGARDPPATAASSGYGTQPSHGLALSVALAASSGYGTQPPDTSGQADPGRAEGGQMPAGHQFSPLGAATAIAGPARNMQFTSAHLPAVGRTVAAALAEFDRFPEHLHHSGPPEIERGHGSR